MRKIGYVVFVLGAVGFGLVAAGCGGSSGDGGGGAKMTIYKAAQLGNMEFVETRLRKGFDVNEPDEGGLTLLHHAALTNQTNLLEVLLDDDGFGANFTIRDNKGRTPLMIAQQAGNEEAWNTLSGYGATQ